MSFHAHLNQGRTRPRFIALENGYHGETLGALAVTDIPLYRRTYAPLMMQPLFAPSPDAYLRHETETEQACAMRAAAALSALLEQHVGEVAALILEPLVQCAGGMRMHHPDYLREARRLCDLHGVHLIADEIAVGFGRTGSLFACAHADITPDLMCVSKGLTGGFLPLAATLVRESIYQAFLDARRDRGFLHSHSYTGNPLACAAALASLSVFRDEDVLERNRRLAGQMAAAADTLRDHPRVAEVRQIGLIVAFELSPDGSRHGVFADALGVGQRAYRAALKQGVLLRPLGNVLYWMPPYCLQPDELELLAGATRIAIDAAVAE